VTERATERRPAGFIPAGRRFRFVAIGYGAVVAGAALFALVGIIGQGEGLAFIPFFMVTMPLSLVLLIVSSQVDRGAAFFAIHLAGGLVQVWLVYLLCRRLDRDLSRRARRDPTPPRVSET
jgi:hypothetical protein